MKKYTDSSPKAVRTMKDLPGESPRNVQFDQTFLQTFFFFFFLNVFFFVILKNYDKYSSFPSSSSPSSSSSSSSSVPAWSLRTNESSSSSSLKSESPLPRSPEDSKTTPGSKERNKKEWRKRWELRELMNANSRRFFFLSSEEPCLSSGLNNRMLMVISAKHKHLKESLLSLFSCWRGLSVFFCLLHTLQFQTCRNL